MRWSSRQKLPVGLKRVVKKFLLFPRCFDNEWRWFETVYIKQEIEDVDVGGSGEWGKFKREWINKSWSSKYEHENYLPEDCFRKIVLHD